MMEVGLSIGSNLGDRLNHLRKAAHYIMTLPVTTIIARSRIYETAPVGVKPEYRNLAYLNAIILISTALPLDDLSVQLHAIEAAMGRIRTDDRFAPRPIDIDILYAGNTIRNDDELTLPHPRWAERRFVLQPLADVRPDMIFPGDQQTVTAILTGLPGESDVIPLPDSW